MIILSACSTDKTPEFEETLTPEVSTQTPTVSEPTPTPEPAAAIVNGERISLAWFEGELERYRLAQEAMGLAIESETAAREVVLNDLIDQLLLAQAAVAEGEMVSDEAVHVKLDALAAEVDLLAWMTDWGYTEDALFLSMKMQMLAGFQREKIAQSIPEVVEQVELRQVFAFTEDGARRAMVSLNSGRAFEDVAFEYDSVTGGYLGWVPRGYLLIPEVEEAAFNLVGDGFSEIIQSGIGYHIVTVLAREARPLSSDARLTLQRAALHNWLAEKRENSDIQVLFD